jgi:F0F1-type ATP synthase assembly protein I
MRGESVQDPNRRAWKRWALLFGLPCSVVALGSVWLYKPDTQAEAIAVAGIAVLALLVFVLTMPRRAADPARRSRASSPDDPA